MGDYADLASLKGKMKRAAIDCWMADQSFDPTWGNADLSYNKWGFAPYQYYRPDENGEGGGEGVGYSVSCADAFDSIRATIDSIVDPWIGLPDGTAATAPKENVASASIVLGNSKTGNVEITTSNDTVRTVIINNIKGQFRGPMLDKYHTQFAKVCNGLGDGCLLLEANYAAEEALWPAARKDVARICSDACDAWAATADDKSAQSISTTLNVLGAVASTVAAVVTSGARVGVTVAAGALAAIGGATSTALGAIEGEAAVSGSSYDSILGSLRAALDKLNSVIYEQESALSTMLSEAANEMRAYRDQYDLDAFPLGDYPSTDGTMAMDRSDTSMVSTNMGRISTSLGSAETRLGSEPASNPTPRNAAIGLGANGTHPAASDLYSLTVGFLSHTTTEYDRGHSLFDATVDDFFAADAAAAAEVARIRADEAKVSEVDA